MTERLPRVWIVIPTWNRREDLLECLASVCVLDYPNYRTVVVDNHSTDGSVESVSREFPEVDLIALEDNKGAAKASNVGFEFAIKRGADYVLRLDSDTVLAPDYLNQLIDVAETDLQIGIVVGTILYHADPERIWSLGAVKTSPLFTTREIGRGQLEPLAQEQVQEIDYAWATGMLLSRQAIDSTGGFDPDFFVYYEEMDLCQRIRSAGLSIRTAPAAKMWHKSGESTPSSWVAYHWARGKMLFFRKHSQGLHRLVLVLYAFAYALFRAIRPSPGVGNRGPLKAALSGLTTGLRHANNPKH